MGTHGTSPPQLILQLIVDALGSHPLAPGAGICGSLVEDQGSVVDKLLHAAVASELGRGMLAADMVPIPPQKKPGQLDVPSKRDT